MLGDDGLEKGFKLQTQTELYSKGPQYHPTRKDGLSREKEGKTHPAVMNWSSPTIRPLLTQLPSLCHLFQFGKVLLWPWRVEQHVMREGDADSHKNTFRELRAYRVSDIS